MFYKIDFRQLLAYLEKVISTAKTNIFFIRLKILGFFSFRYSQLGRHQTWQFDNKRFPKMFFAMVLLGMCQPLKYVFFRPQNTQALRFLLMLRQEKSSVTVSEQINSKIFFALKGLGMYFITNYDNTFSKISFPMEIWGMCLPYVKKLFQPHQRRLFFFRSQNTRGLSFLLKLVWERKGHSARAKHL